VRGDVLNAFTQLRDARRAEAETGQRKAQVEDGCACVCECGVERGA
jgi:hypothetical protein